MVVAPQVRSGEATGRRTYSLDTITHLEVRHVARIAVVSYEYGGCLRLRLGLGHRKRYGFLAEFAVSFVAGTLEATAAQVLGGVSKREFYAPRPSCERGRGN